MKEEKHWKRKPSSGLSAQRIYFHLRTAIEAEILFAARVTQVRFLKRLSGKTPLEQNSSGKKIEAESAVPILVYLCIVIMVHKYRQSAKESYSLKRNTLPEVFSLTIGSGKTVPFEKRRNRYKETAENKAEAYRVYVEHLFSACDAVDARIFSKGDGDMTRKISTTNLPGARGNAYPKAELDYDLTYEYDPAYAHRLVHAGNRYYRYDANGNITAEKDGHFTEDDEFIFTYSYDPDTDVYGTDYGFGLDAPKETEETHPENLFAYRRNYTWNEKNLLTKSSDRSYTVHYRYGEDGQRALKYTEEGRSETLYFNNFYTIHIPVQDKNNPQGLRVHKHIFVGNSRLVTAMTHTDNNGDNAEQREKRYYYHSDHLGSAQFVTDWRGRQYEHIEYTPYGELWIEEVAAGLDKLRFRFTGKEMDEETGLYYYGTRYLDPKYSRWLSGDPALGDYVPAAGTDPSKLAGMGGVYNTVNLHLYHYAGNNPVKYTDPTGREDGGFSSSQQKQILEAKEKAINNINLIIDYINNYGKNGNFDARLKKTAKAYLNFDMDNFGDRKDLISALQSIATDLSSMSLSDFKHTDDYSSGGVAYVQPEIVMKGSQIISTRFLKDMYLTDAAFIGNPDYGNGLGAIFIHEESHKVLGTKDILYDYGTRDIIYKPGTTDILFGRDDDCRKLPNNQKISNADNWKLFYFKMGK